MTTAEEVRGEVFANENECSRQLHQNTVMLQLRPKKLFMSKANPQHARKYFDSGEYFCKKAGLQLQDVLPGDVPVEQCPVKMEKFSPTPPHRSLLQLESPRSMNLQ